MSEQRQYAIHPIFIMLTLVLVGITVLFLGFSGAYLYNRMQSGQLPVTLPSLFYTNTLFLIGSSVCLWAARQAYVHDQTSRFKMMLWGTVLLSIIFIVLQVIAWQQMINMNISLKDGPLSAYMYVISGLHFAHVLAGIPFLGVFLWNAHRRLKEPVSILIYLSDHQKMRHLRAIEIYWHFLDALWIYLILFFLINSLI